MEKLTKEEARKERLEKTIKRIKATAEVSVEDFDLWKERGKESCYIPTFSDKLLNLEQLCVLIEDMRDEMNFMLGASLYDEVAALYFAFLETKSDWFEERRSAMKQGLVKPLHQ